MAMSEIPRPFLKWAGGKTQLLPELLKRIPDAFNAYHEPFLGGGALFWALARKSDTFTGPVFLGDVNRELVDTFRAIRSQHEMVRGELERVRYHHQDTGEDTFCAWRRADPWRLPLDARAARMIFLNKTGFNGLYRVNADGLFNVPWGQNKNAGIFDASNLEACSIALRQTEILCESFGSMTYRVNTGDLVYLDPPYVPVKGDSFTGFTKEKFDMRDQEQLAQCFEGLVKRGAFVILSNSDTDWVRDRYKAFKIDRIEAKRAINSKGDKRGPVGEVIVNGWT